MKDGIVKSHIPCIAYMSFYKEKILQFIKQKNNILIFEEVCSNSGNERLWDHEPNESTIVSVKYHWIQNLQVLY